MSFYCNPCKKLKKPATNCPECKLETNRMAIIAEELMAKARAKMQLYYDRIAVEAQAQAAAKAQAAAAQALQPQQLQAVQVSQAPSPLPPIAAPVPKQDAVAEQFYINPDLFLPQDLPLLNDDPAVPVNTEQPVMVPASLPHAQLRAAMASPRSANFAGGLDHWIRSVSIAPNELKANPELMANIHQVLTQYGYNRPAPAGQGLCFPLCIWVKCSVTEAGQLAERLLPLAIYGLAFDPSGAQKRTPTKATTSEHQIATLGGWLISGDESLDVSLLSPTEVRNLSMVGYQSLQQPKCWFMLAKNDVLGCEMRKFLPYLGLDKEKGFNTRLVSSADYCPPQMPPLLLPKPRTAEERKVHGKKAVKAALLN